MIPDRPYLPTSKLSLAMGLVLAFVCFFGFQASNRVDQQPLSVADQLLYSVAAHSSHFNQGVKGVASHGSIGLFDDGPDALLSTNEWPLLEAPAANNTQRLALAAPLNKRSLQQPQPRAPPVV